MQINHKGLSTHLNQNGFFVAQVHYTADPEKDPSTPEGKKWYENARRGMPEVLWRKEYEIDWFARSGQLVYPLFRRDIHVVNPFSVPPHWTRFMAIDPGLRNPTAALWAAVDEDDSIFLYDEYYVSEKTIQEHCAAILAKEKNDKIFLRLIDPSSSGRNMISKVSNRDEYARYGVCCVLANNDLEVGIDRVNQCLSLNIATGEPRLFFFSNLVNTIREISNYRWEESDPETAIKKDPPERPTKRQDHLMDCLRYIIMADPHFVRPAQVPRHKPHARWEGMTTGY